MLPEEINLPVGANIFQIDESRENSLTDKDIKQRLTETGILELIVENKTLLIINDHHRSTPSPRIMRILANEVPNNKLDRVIIASGTHEPANLYEQEIITEYQHRNLEAELLVHDSKNAEFIQYGTTERGTPVEINAIVDEYDQVLCINSVEPHYFAGFTGGIKSLVPGLAKYETVVTNHSWAMHEASSPASINENPLQQDLWEAGNMIPVEKYGIQLVINEDRIIGMTAGKLKKAFNIATRLAAEKFVIEVDKQFDVIVSLVFPPLNQSLYQAQKGIENTVSALKPGGEMVLVAKCPEGIGNDAFFSTMEEYEDPKDVLNDLSRESYEFGDHKAYKFAKLANEGKISIVTKLSHQECRTVFAEKIYFDRLEEKLSRLTRENKSIAVVIDAGMITIRPK